MRGGTCLEGRWPCHSGGTASSLAVLWDEEQCHEGHGLTRLRAARVGSKEGQVRGEGGGRKDAWRRERQKCSALFGGGKKKSLFFYKAFLPCSLGVVFLLWVVSPASLAGTAGAVSIGGVGQEQGGGGSKRKLPRGLMCRELAAPHPQRLQE